MNAIVTLNLYGTEAVIYDTVLGSLAQEVHYFGSPPYDYCTGIPDIFRSILIARFPFPATAVLLLLLLFTHTARCQTRPANSALVSLWGSAKKILYLLFSHIHQHRIRFLSNLENLWHAFTPIPEVSN